MTTNVKSVADNVALWSGFGLALSTLMTVHFVEFVLGMVFFAAGLTVAVALYRGEFK